MTLQQLQEFLDAEKWKDSEAHACDMCGRYARCRYCMRTQEYPCAMAHNRMVEATRAPVPDSIPDWLLPEPDVYAQFGDEIAREEIPAVQTEEKAPSAAADVSADAAPVSAPVLPVNDRSSRPHVIMRGKGEVRLCTLQRRIPTVSSELGI